MVAQSNIHILITVYYTYNYNYLYYYIFLSFRDLRLNFKSFICDIISYSKFFIFMLATVIHECEIKNRLELLEILKTK
jgi:hypothetical protein